MTMIVAYHMDVSFEDEGSFDVIGIQRGLTHDGIAHGIMAEIKDRYAGHIIHRFFTFEEQESQEKGFAHSDAIDRDLQKLVEVHNAEIEDAE